MQLHTAGVVRRVREPGTSPVIALGDRRVYGKIPETHTLTCYGHPMFGLLG